MNRLDEAPIGSFGIASILASLAFLLAGIAMPEAAESLLRLLLLTFAVGFVAARAYGAMLPSRTTRDLYSPFDDPGAGRTPLPVPHGVRDLARGLGAADDPRVARRTEIPWSIRWTVIDEASRRLAAHHGLSLDDPSDHAAIRSLVSGPTWTLIDPRERQPRRERQATADARPVALSQLDLILDDMEGL